MQDSQNEFPAVDQPVEAQAQKPRRKLWMVIGAVALVTLLGGAAYVAGRLISPPDTAQAGNGGPGLYFSGPGGKSVSIKETKAKELPQTSPTVVGVMTGRQDNVLSLGTGKISVNTHIKPGAQPTTQASYTGPVVQIVVAHDTQIYKDVTPLNPEELFKTGGKVQQVVAPGTIDDIGQNTMVQVWGNRQGDRITASVLLYRANPAG
jgi:hypothetical protein